MANAGTQSHSTQEASPSFRPHGSAGLSFKLFPPPWDCVCQSFGNSSKATLACEAQWDSPTTATENSTVPAVPKNLGMASEAARAAEATCKLAHTICSYSFLLRLLGFMQQEVRLTQRRADLMGEAEEVLAPEYIQSSTVSPLEAYSSPSATPHTPLRSLLVLYFTPDCSRAVGRRPYQSSLY